MKIDFVEMKNTIKVLYDFLFLVLNWMVLCFAVWFLCNLAYYRLKTPSPTMLTCYSPTGVVVFQRMVSYVVYSDGYVKIYELDGSSHTTSLQCITPN